MKNLNDLLKILLENNTEFVAIGGFAAVLHGSSQVTKALDICTSITPEQISKFRETLKDLNPKHRMTPKKLSFLDYPEELSDIKNLYLQTDLGIVDIIGNVIGIGEYEEVAKNAVTIELFGKKCKVISIKDLISSKEKMDREKDKTTIKEMKAVLATHKNR